MDGQLAHAGGDQSALIGDESMDRGARTKHIRDALLQVERATPQDMLNVQLDNRALFLKRWRNALIALLDEAYLRAHPARDEAKQLLLRWSERADVDDAGYRIVRAFRLAVQDEMYRGLIAAAQARYPQATFKPSARFEDTAWRIMTEQPAHLRNGEYENWDAQLLASLDRALLQLMQECDVVARKLSSCTWGQRNTLKMEHPLSNALPVLGRWLRMPLTELPAITTCRVYKAHRSARRNALPFHPAERQKVTSICRWTEWPSVVALFRRGARSVVKG